MSKNNVIEVHDLQFMYPGVPKKVLQGLHFSVRKGEIFGFLGPSGSGKSTTQNVLIGILKGYTGSVRILDQEIKTIQPDFYERIGVAFEMPNFYNKFTALENLHYFRSFYERISEDPVQLLSQMGLEKEAHKRLSEFSKGMKARLNLCRALLHRPEILFLDEPTSGLDPGNAKKIKELLLRLKAEGTAIFLTTHNMHVAEEICDRVAFITDGKIRLIDSPRKLKLQQGQKTVHVEYRQGEKHRVAQFKLRDLGYNTQFSHLLRAGNIETMHTQEASLEDIFIQVTGRRLV